MRRLLPACLQYLLRRIVAGRQRRELVLALDSRIDQAVVVGVGGAIRRRGRRDRVSVLVEKVDLPAAEAMFIYFLCPPRVLLSFPTRRSSDLLVVQEVVAGGILLARRQSFGT